MTKSFKIVLSVKTFIKSKYKYIYIGVGLWGLGMWNFLSPFGMNASSNNNSSSIHIPSIHRYIDKCIGDELLSVVP